MKLFHPHVFTEKDNILWCSCGKIVKLPQKGHEHKWKIFKESKEETPRIDLQCEICGDFTCHYPEN